MGDKISEDEKNEIMQKGKRVIDKFCSSKPVVAIIPINSKKYKLTAYHATTNFKYENQPLLTEILAKDTGSYSPENPLSIFTEKTAFIEVNNLGNLIHKGKIPASEMCFVEIDDSFSLMQKKALAQGMKSGDEIDFFTGREYTPIKPLYMRETIEENEKESSRKKEVKTGKKKRAKQEELETEVISTNAI